MDMNATATLEELRRWPVDDQFELVCGLWDQIVELGWKPTISPELSAELDRRVAEYEANPDDVLTWEQVEAYLRRPR